MPMLNSLFLAVAAAAAPPLPSAPLRPVPSCHDDYVTVETVRGRILEIKPSPEPFRSADIFFLAPPPCDRMWMQVLKPDAARCRVGGRIAVTGIVTADVENNAWQIGPRNNAYLTLGDDFACE
jgi:hypothetical protein